MHNTTARADSLTNYPSLLQLRVRRATQLFLTKSFICRLIKPVRLGSLGISRVLFRLADLSPRRCTSRAGALRWPGNITSTTKNARMVIMITLARISRSACVLDRFLFWNAIGAYRTCRAWATD